MRLQGLRTCKFHISVLELSSYNKTILSKERFACFRTGHGYVSVTAGNSDHNDDGITFDIYDLNRVE